MNATYTWYPTERFSISDFIPSLFMEEVEWVGMDRDRPGHMSYSFVTYKTPIAVAKARRFREVVTFGLLPARLRRVHIVFDHWVDRDAISRRWARFPGRPSALRLPLEHEFAVFGRFEGEGTDDFAYLVAIRHVDARRRIPPDNNAVEGCREKFEYWKQQTRHVAGYLEFPSVCTNEGEDVPSPRRVPGLLYNDSFTAGRPAAVGDEVWRPRNGGWGRVPLIS